MKAKLILIFLYLHRYLSFADPKNFTSEKLKQIKVMLLEYLYSLYVKTINVETNTETLQGNITNDESKTGPAHKLENIYDISNFEPTNVDDDDDPFAQIYQQIAKEEQTQETVAINSNTETLLEEKQKELKQKLTDQVEKYTQDCSKLEIVNVLDRFGTDAYITWRTKQNKNKEEEEKKKNKNKTDKKNNTPAEVDISPTVPRTGAISNIKQLKACKRFEIDIHRIVVKKDAMYISNYFDLMKWWKIYGSYQYKELSTGASIFLGKPTHNGFQERVFSRGTYADCKLKKNLQPEF